jgi:hypothetical protein
LILCIYRVGGETLGLEYSRVFFIDNIYQLSAEIFKRVKSLQDFL